MVCKTEQDGTGWAEEANCPSAGTAGHTGTHDLQSCYTLAVHLRQFITDFYILRSRLILRMGTHGLQSCYTRPAFWRWAVWGAHLHTFNNIEQELTAFIIYRKLTNHIWKERASQCKMNELYITMFSTQIVVYSTPSGEKALKWILTPDVQGLRPRQGTHWSVLSTYFYRTEPALCSTESTGLLYCKY